MSIPRDQHDSSDQDTPLWDLLARDADRHPITPSPWFATRVAAQALATPQKGRRSYASLLRWLIPIPLACSALLAITAWNHSRTLDDRFEQNMELLTSSDYDFESQDTGSL